MSWSDVIPAAGNGWSGFSISDKPRLLLETTYILLTEENLPIALEPQTERWTVEQSAASNTWTEEP